MVFGRAFPKKTKAEIRAERAQKRAEEREKKRREAIDRYKKREEFFTAEAKAKEAKRRARGEPAKRKPVSGGKTVRAVGRKLTRKRTKREPIRWL